MRKKKLKLILKSMNIKKLTLVHAVLPNPLAHNRIDRRSEKNYSS
jgi:hypothetical protein